jgi:hypothetical protein
LPFFEEHSVRMVPILTDRETEYYGNRKTHEYALYVDIEKMQPTRRSRLLSANADLSDASPFTEVLACLSSCEVRG